jgi:hypothetical protein
MHRQQQQQQQQQQLHALHTYIAMPFTTAAIF